jgi:carbon-monoxide dehydrogenase small subunit
VTPVAIELRVNGAWWSGAVEPRTLLADLLRDRLGLTGTHLGCEQGACGACTVLMDGVAIRSCLTLAVQAARHDLITIEGLAPAGTLTAVQAAFLRHRAFQCGFCTPGFVMTAEALRRGGVKGDDPRLPELLSGNICRCTGYRPILAALRECLPSA